MKLDSLQNLEHKKRQPHKIVKHTETIHLLLPMNCLSVFDHFVGLVVNMFKVNNKDNRKTPKINTRKET